MTIPPQNAGAYCPAIRELTDAAPSKLPALDDEHGEQHHHLDGRQDDVRLLDEPHVLEALAIGDEAHGDVAASPADSADTTNRMSRMALFHSGYAFTTPSKEAGVSRHGEREHDADHVSHFGTFFFSISRTAAAKATGI